MHLPDSMAVSKHGNHLVLCQQMLVVEALDRNMYRWILAVSKS